MHTPHTHSLLIFPQLSKQVRFSLSLTKNASDDPQLNQEHSYPLLKHTNSLTIK
ncbi:hypothetical protein JHK82_035017 [Glycine max]|uniref:Uncharacterized protein n=1 Tax=Glycine soja TaxID=3848 RepID=A0A445HA34_GLYSO|nr:hypothetical protein JHK87_034960 [Glycine soja]KAG4969336.1 hypothetical protein JHK85_035757 [Glycine max]KAG4975640.1 hypothetical protein JHK86_035114 [Glycine max]KAG5111748.1 hypothetical protein JHK82_035017 [Glycine max]KAG5129031.1 hypothetical protein JHK84_035428 [Glycine max]